LHFDIIIFNIHNILNRDAVLLKEKIPITRGGNRVGRFGFGFGSDGSGQFDFLIEIGSGQGRVGSIYMLCFFRSLIDFDWILKVI
jgi:hypothetical protein